MIRPIYFAIIASIVLFSYYGSVCAQSKTDTVRHSKDSVVVTITAQRPLSVVGIKSYRDSDFKLRPLNSAQDMMRLVPGLVLAQHAGGGKAEQMFLRGFDADHGTDVNISVDDAPVNMLSHGHGQGYADLHFIIPETIGDLDVTKGPYSPRYGDLATAGVVAFHTKDSLTDNLVKLEGGSFGEYRALALLKGPSSSNIQSYFGGDIFGTQGYFVVPQDFHRLDLMGKVTASLGGDAKLTGSIFNFSSGWNANGQIPQRAVDSGLISRFGSLDSTEGGQTSRTTAIMTYNSGGENPLTITGSITNYRFRLFSDFTFFLVDSTQGDEVEQTDARTLIALRGERSLPPWTLGDAIMKTTIGVNTRSDDITVGLYHDSARVRLNTEVNADVDEREVGPYIQQEIGLSWINFLLGVRADYVTVDVSNLLNPSAQPNGINQQLLISPKVNATIPISDEATGFLNFGYGFHSNDARAIVESPGTPTLPRAMGEEAGLAYGEPNDLFSGSVSLWEIDLQSELTYDGDIGETVAQGRTRRQGVDLEGRLSPASWLTIGGDATFSHGRFLDSAAGHNFIPLAPNMMLTANAIARFGGFSTALRLRHIDNRPADNTNTLIAQGYSIFDLSLSYKIGRCELYSNIENIFNTVWSEAQFATDTRIYVHGILEPEAITDLCFTAGTPISVRAGMSYRFN